MIRPLHCPHNSFTVVNKYILGRVLTQVFIDRDEDSLKTVKAVITINERLDLFKISFYEIKNSLLMFRRK